MSAQCYVQTHSLAFTLNSGACDPYPLCFSVFAANPWSDCQIESAALLAEVRSVFTADRAVDQHLQKRIFPFARNFNTHNRKRYCTPKQTHSTPQN